MKAKPNKRKSEGNKLRRSQRAGPEPVLRSARGRSESVTFDLAKRKHEGEDPRRSAQLYSRLLKSLDCIVWEADARTFQFSFVSPQAKRILGYAPEEWLSPGFWTSHVHSEDVEWCTKFCMQATEEGRDHQFEYRMLAADGRTVWLHDVVSVQVAPDGPKRLTGVMIDVTGRKLAETARQEREEQLRLVFEKSAAGIVIGDTSGRIIRANQRFCELVGFSQDELQGRTAVEITHPADREVTQAYLEEAKLGRTGICELEKRYVRPDRQVVWGSMSAVFVFPDTQAPYSICVVQDITGRKRAEELLRLSEERFRTIFENAGLGAALVSWEGHPIKCNPALQKMLGYTESELRNMVFTEFTHPDDIDLDWKLYSELVAGERDKYEIEKRYFTKDGRLMWGHLTVSQVKNKDGTPEKYTIGMVVDISERKLAEDEIVRLSQRLINAQEEERTRMARELHDDLGQQIAALGIALSNIKRGIPDDLCETREQVERAYRRLLEVGEGVRNLSHELHPAILEHAGLVAALESYCTEFEALAHVSGKVHADGRFGDLPTNVQLGIYRITQEALQNIWKHSRAREGIIYLERHKESVQMRISDQGIGFDAAQHSKGRGLGLVSMRERAQLLGGTLTVESSPGHGTTIIVGVPVGSAARPEKDVG